VSVLAAASLRADDFDAWILNHGQTQTTGSPAEKRLAVGSLQKPFLVRAWATAHPHDPTPRVTCTKTSLCWRTSGHGTLDLRGALRESCNTYFRHLSRETPQGAIRAALSDAGFSFSGELSDAEAIGLPGPADVMIDPEQLLTSYVALARSPWALREDVRRELLEALRDSASSGTASGLRLFGFMAKTGTVPALDGAPLKTSGFVMALDDAGFAFLGLLRRGTGREAAIRAGDAIAKARPGLIRRAAAETSRPGPKPRETKRSLEGPVRVLMLDELRLEKARLRNLGPGPVDSSRGFVGPGAQIGLAPGDRFGVGQWEITAEKPKFIRRLRGAVSVEDREGPIRIVATMSARDYANGILKAELGTANTAVRAQLAATVLRFLRRGARHADAEVCDSTHCAWFVGEGPVPRWLRPEAVTNERDIAADLSDAEWTEAARDVGARPLGTDLWSADCGGEPASPHFIWGGGDRRVTVCPRHPKGSGRPWRRDWPAADLVAVFGTRPEAIEVATVDGQWMLKVRLSARERGRGSTAVALTYDEVHRRLAERLGWDAMPSPASRVRRSAAGFVAEGVGFGHRVGLCLARQ
jgi:hypothetical protein